jgi:MFS family permease
MMNCGFGVARIISPLVFGYLVDRTGSWTLPFAGSILLLLGAALAFRMHPDRPFEPSGTLGDGSGLKAVFSFRTPRKRQRTRTVSARLDLVLRSGRRTRDHGRNVPAQGVGQGLQVFGVATPTADR